MPLKFWRRPAVDRRKSTPEERARWNAEREDRAREEREEVERRLRFLEAEARVLTRLTDRMERQ